MNAAYRADYQRLMSHRPTRTPVLFLLHPTQRSSASLADISVKMYPQLLYTGLKVSAWLQVLLLQDHYLEC